MVSIQIESETGMAVATCSGVVRHGDAWQAALALWRAEGWRGVAAVWDFRDAKFDVSSADVRDLARFVLRRQPAPPPTRIAFVTGREVDFGLARMFETYREDPRTAIRVLRSYDEAISWARASRPDVPDS